MKIFLSWSGIISQKVAETLRPWLRQVIQGLEPFISSHNISAGNFWPASLMKALEESQIGIILLTKENMRSTWLLFETGALFKGLEKSKICIVLLNVNPSELTPPLSYFQVTTVQEEDFFKLITSIYNALERPLITAQELREQFNRLWKDVEDSIKQILSTTSEEKSALEELTETLLLPAIYKQINDGDLDTVFQWLHHANTNQIARLDSPLGFIEASLARITGKRQAPINLKKLSNLDNHLSTKAQLELLFFYFAAGDKLDEIIFNRDLIEKSSKAIRKTYYALLSIWNLRENNESEAQRLFDKTEPEKITNDYSDYYRSIPMGILCFAFGKAELGEQYFDLTRSAKPPKEGYPFTAMLSELDKAFVNACIGHETYNISDIRIRELRGHAWVLVKYAELMYNNKNIIHSISSITTDWRTPLTTRFIANKLLNLQKKLTSCSGYPLLPF